tara:strand:- start:919 stop:1536 length:618 start_codon:yes stop_codon:yes gene_type:complete
MRYNKTFKEALRQVREEPDHEISMARGELKATADKALELVAALEGKSDEGNPMEAWVQSKITKAKDYINSVYDYLMYNPSVAKEDFDDINRQRRQGGQKHVAMDKDKSKDTISDLKNQIQMLKLELENEKNKTVKPEPNPDTGEVPLRTGIAQAMLDKTTPQPQLKKVSAKKFMKSLGKSKIEVNPDVEIGVYSGGKKVPNGNLH